MKRSTCIIILLALTLFYGCVSILQSKFAQSDKMYPGPHKTREQIAILVQNEFQKVHLEMINGKLIEKGYGVVFELLPGPYSLCVRLFYSSGNKYYTSKVCRTVDFIAKSGRTYEFYEVEIYNNDISKWHPSVRDITDDLNKPEMEQVSRKIENILLNSRNK